MVNERIRFCENCNCELSDFDDENQTRIVKLFANHRRLSIIITIVFFLSLSLTHKHTLAPIFAQLILKQPFGRGRDDRRTLSPSEVFVFTLVPEKSERTRV